ncbi:MAG: Crp/Fnr family transcriptional regulator [Dehalococcoidales bacterium]|nr:Crp/Fnr family transcriptional regulator [Dehalococcoidales bacterium]
MSQDDLARLSELAGERSFKAGEFVFWEGDPPGYFYVVTAGRIKVIKHASSGKEIIIAFFGPGEMFGEVAVFENKPYPASAQADVDTDVLAIKRERFIDFLSRQPGVALGIISVLSGRLRDAQARLKDLSGERVEQRLARTLYRLYAKLGSTLPFTRQEIADMSGTTTETAIRIMGQFKERGIIISVRGRIVILDETKLRLLSEGPPQV